MSDRNSTTNIFSMKIISLAFVAFSLLSLPGCDMAANYLKDDREANLENQDYRDMMAAREPEMASTNTGTIPALQPYIANTPSNVKPMPLVSISVNQTVPLRDVLFELAQQAEYDIELDPNIRGSIIFTARNRAFDSVIERISDIAGLRYKFEDDTLRVELDTPYNKVYKIDYLSYIRTTSSTVRNDIGVVSGQGADTGSEFEASSTGESDFWGELEVNLQQMIGRGEQSSLRTRSDPRISVTQQNPEMAAISPVQGEDGLNVQAPEAVLRVDSLPVAGEEEGDNGDRNTGFSFAMNRQAGLINVYANEKTHREIRNYLQSVRKAVTAQVLIEAKILEVGLTDEFASGVDWRLVNPISGNSAVNFLSGDADNLLNSIAGGTGAGLAPTLFSDADTSFMLGYAGSDIQGLVNALSRFGTVRALASPRLTVLNNQSAVLNVATNQVFFEVDIDITQGTDSTPPQTTIESEIRNVPEGVLVNVQPSINLDNNTVSLAVRPTVTRIVGEVEDPGIQFVAQSNNINISSLVPELNVQEIDSVISVRSGQPVVMGGLLQDRVQNSQEGVPVLGEVPVLGALFKDKTDRIQKTELVILLKATIVPYGAGTIDNTDKDFYRKFGKDRRPFRL